MTRLPLKEFPAAGQTAALADIPGPVFSSRGKNSGNRSHYILWGDVYYSAGEFRSLLLNAREPSMEEHSHEP